MFSFGKSNDTKKNLRYEGYQMRFYVKKYGFQEKSHFSEKQVANIISLVLLQNEDHTIT